MLKRTGQPLYLQLKEKLLEDIRANYKNGDIIPAEGKIEKKYEVSRITVRKAIETLVHENVLIKKQGRGTFVKEQKILYNANSFGSMTQRLTEQNRTLTTKSIAFELIKDEHFVKEIIPCETLLCIRRTKLLDEVPFAIMINYFDLSTVPELDKKLNLESLYAFLKKEYNIEFDNAEETIEAKAANKYESQRLEIKEKTPVLSLSRVAYDKNSKPLEYSNLIIKSDMYQHKILLSN